MMIDSILNMLFRCSHQRLTRPVTPVSRDGESQGGTYVVCLDCGKQFTYDLKLMRVGKPLPRKTETGVLRPDMPGPRRSKLKVAAAASAVPLAFALGSILTSNRPRNRELPEGKPETPTKPDEQAKPDPEPHA